MDKPLKKSSRREGIGVVLTVVLALLVGLVLPTMFR